jgi:hypothetical protein
LMVMCVLIFGQTVCLADTPETWQSRKMDGRIISIDRNSHEITMTDRSGNTITFLTSKKIVLDNLHEGDMVNVTYHVAIGTEIRKPTADERQKTL